jgi:diguanylate cyclase (GGDEF)-like protein
MLVLAFVVLAFVVLVMVVLAVVTGLLARQTRALSQTRAELRQAQQRLTALHQIALSLSTTLDVGRLLEIILDQLSHLWGQGTILLLDEPTHELVLAAGRGSQADPGHRFPADQGAWGQVVQTGQPVATASELAVPLVWKGQTLGVLSVQSATPNAYNPADLHLLATVAEQAAAAIGNARLHQRTLDLAMTDAHTGLYNYRYFQEQVATAVRDTQLTGAQVALVMLDVDYFKRINDTYGHPTGDWILQQVARVLQESCRQEDLLFRYAGDEFAIILPGTPRECAMLVAERVRERMAAHTFITRSGRPLDFPVTVSLGVATHPADGLTPVDMLLAADAALYAAKGAGRNRVTAAGGSGAHGHGLPA